jgi:hypothetical protein
MIQALSMAARMPKPVLADQAAISLFPLFNCFQGIGLLTIQFFCQICDWPHRAVLTQSQ